MVMEAVMDAVMDAVMKTVFSVTPDAREPFFVINIYPLGHPSPIEGGGTPSIRFGWPLSYLRVLRFL